MQNVLLDTGAVVALIDRNDVNHENCSHFFKNFRGKLHSTEAVLTESLYLLGNSFENQKKCFQFFLLTVHLAPANLESLENMIKLMEKYQDTPMDFADATLVTLAEDLECPEIFTLDRRGFETYRWGRNHSFKIYPEK